MELTYRVSVAVGVGDGVRVGVLGGNVGVADGVNVGFSLPSPVFGIETCVVGATV